MNWSSEWGKPQDGGFTEKLKQSIKAEVGCEPEELCGVNPEMLGIVVGNENKLQQTDIDYQTQSIKLGNKTIFVIVVGDLGLDFCEPGEKDEGWNIYHLPTLQSVNSGVPGTFDHRVDCAIAMNKTCNCGYDEGLKYGPYYNYDKPELLRWMAKVQTNYLINWEVLRVLTPDDYHDKGTINKEIIKKWCLSVKVE